MKEGSNGSSVAELKQSQQRGGLLITNEHSCSKRPDLQHSSHYHGKRNNTSTCFPCNGSLSEACQMEQDTSRETSHEALGCQHTVTEHPTSVGADIIRDTNFNDMRFLANYCIRYRELAILHLCMLYCNTFPRRSPSPSHQRIEGLTFTVTALMGVHIWKIVHSFLLSLRAPSDQTYALFRLKYNIAEGRRGSYLTTSRRQASAPRSNCGSNYNYYPRCYCTDLLTYVQAELLKNCG